MDMINIYKKLGIKGKLAILMLATNLLMMLTLFLAAIPILNWGLQDLWNSDQSLLINGYSFSLTRILWLLAAGFTLAGLAVMGISWVALRTITGPLSAFALHLQKSGEKRGLERLFSAGESTRELCCLAESFNRMILTIDRQEGELQGQLDKLHEQAVQLEEEIASRQRTEEELLLVSAQHEAATRLMQSICDNVPDLIWAKDLKHRYIFSNRANNETLLFPSTPDEPIGKTHEYFSTPLIVSHPDDPHWYSFSDLCAQSDALTLSTRRSMQFREFGFVKGTRVCLDVYKAPLHDSGGTLIGTIGSARIVTHEQELEAESLKLNRLYRVLSSINKLIIRRPRPEELAREVCRIAVAEGEFATAWIGTPDDSMTTLRPLACSGGFSLEQLEDIGVNSHICRSASILLHGQPVVINDITNDTEQLLCPTCLQLYREKEFRSLASYPISSEGRTAMVLSMYSTEPNFFDSAEKALLQEMCGDIGYAIDVYTLDQTQQFLTNYDPLTGLPNRTMLGLQLEHAVAHAKRESRNLALLHVDLDRFKELNESYGHSIGDDLLRQAAARLAGRLRQTDMISRPGGDEFTVILEQCDSPQDSARVASDILSILAEPFELQGGVSITISASIGIVIFPEHGINPHDLMQNADSALYLAKSEGRGCFRFYSEHLTAYARERLDLESRLRAGFLQGTLQVYFQPQVDIPTGMIIGAEALLRWFEPDVGQISPARFIPIAEESGLILKIGEWVLREVCRQGSEWLQNGLPKIMLAVNLSPLQLKQDDVVSMVRRTLEETGYPAELLELEVTESALMEHGEKALAVLRGLRDLGVGLALDDFGTGYSSLAYLKYFPLNVLKIDKSFVDDLPDGLNDRKIVTTIVKMGQQLGFKVLAEGVEREEQLKFLASLGCDMFQGYLLSTAVPAETMATLLSSDNHGAT